jgi:CPA2 family monovalent cation:H+ antiporter-2
MHDVSPIVMNLAACLSAALILGFVTERLKLSPIVGYLLAGVAVGPLTPGFVADRKTAEQLADIGVVLLMFGVGMHFDLRDLMAVRRVALPGAIGQVIVATVLGMLAVVAAGLGWTAGAVIGVAISVASTVVLIRVLSDNNVLDSEQGHIAVGWLIVEDLFTVFVLVILPALAKMRDAEAGAGAALVQSLSLAVLQIVLLGIAVLWVGRRFIPRLLETVARTRARELFTLAILVIALSIAVGSSLIFGVSMALGAFLAGMIVRQSEVSHQAAADALPMRDAFAVLFFVSVGMLFDPTAIRDNPLLFFTLLFVILVAKPLTAIAIVWALGYSFRTALTVAVGLAQIGEFSFILADAAAGDPAAGLGLLGQSEKSLLIACAILSISLNPWLFRTITPIEAWLRRRPKIWRFIARRSEARVRGLPVPTRLGESSDKPRAIIVGYGPVGKTASTILTDFGIEPVVVDLNVDTVANLLAMGKLAVYGDAAQREILTAAGVANAKYLLLTIPDLQTRTVIVLVARELNPELKIFVRARYMEERAWLEEIGATEVCFEEAEAAIGLASLLLREVGADEDRIRLERRRIRTRLAFQALPDSPHFDPPASPPTQ